MQLTSLSKADFHPSQVLVGLFGQTFPKQPNPHPLRLSRGPMCRFTFSLYICLVPRDPFLHSYIHNMSCWKYKLLIIEPLSPFLNLSKGLFVKYTQTPFDRWVANCCANYLYRFLFHVEPNKQKILMLQREKKMNDDLSLQTQLAASDYWWFQRAAVNRNSCNAMITIISLPDLLCHVKWFKFICPPTPKLSFKVTDQPVQL